LAAELFKSSAGVDMQIVPFNGSPAVITALRGGQIDAAVEILAPVLPQINAKALRALAVTGTKRAAVLPDVPTAKESGVTNYEAASWNAIAAPSKTPKSVIARLNKEITAALNSPDVKKRLADQNVAAQASTPEQAAELLASEVKRWGEVIVRAKVPQQ
jgi:tripartite-type tricarboxylate transporter receptor subunit TctC